MTSAVSLHFVSILKRHVTVAFILTLISVTILANAVARGDAGRALVYFAAIAVSVVCIDVCLALWPAADRSVPVRDAGVEVAIAAACFAAGIVWLYARFVLQYRPTSSTGRLVWLALLLGFVFNLALATLLLARRYRLADLGWRLTGLPPAPVIIAVFAIGARLSHSGVSWAALVDENGGSIWAVAGTAISAALPEEFLRFV